MLTFAVAKNGRAAADAILKDIFGLDRIAKADPLTRPGFDSFVLETLYELKKVADPIEHEALVTMVSQLQRQWGGLSAAEQKKAIDAAAKDYLGISRDIGPKVGPVLQDHGERVVVATRLSTASTFKLQIEPSFDIVDEHAVAFAAQSQGNFIRNAQGVRAVQLSQVARNVVADGIAEGLDYHDIGKNLADRMSQTDAARADSYWKLIASVFVARARTYSTLRSFDEAGIASYQFESVLDERTSHICRFLHGKVFPVAGALKAFAASEDAEDPEEVKAIQPWPSVGKTENGDTALYLKQADGARKLIARVEESALGQKDNTGKYSHAMSNGEMSEAGMSQPPLHGHCRSTLVPVFGASRPPNPEPAPEPPQAPRPPLVAAPTLPVVVPSELPSNLAALVRPLPTTQHEDFETPGKFSPEYLATKAALDKLNALPNALDWSTKYVKAPISGTPLGADMEIAFAPKVTGPHVTNALKAPPQTVPIKNIVMGHSSDAPVVSKEMVAAHIQGAEYDGKKPLVIKFKGNYYIHETVDSTKGGFTGPFLSPNQVGVLATKHNALGHTTMDVHVIDGDAIAAKPPKPPKPPKVAPVVAAPPPPPPVVAASLPKASGAVSAETILAQNTGSPRGSNTGEANAKAGGAMGGFYTGSDGVKRYVKFYEDPTQAHCEHLANSIYRDLGLSAPDSQLFKDPKTGALGYASRIFEGGETLQKAGLNEDRAKKFMKGFTGDVLTGNWDAVGTGMDNAMVLPGGKIARIDNGGSFLFRAKFGKKASSVLNDITEWEGFFNEGLNPYYTKVAKAAGVSSPEDMIADVRDGVAAVKNLRDKHGGWQGYVDKIAGDMKAPDKAQVVKMLEERTRLLQERVGEFDKPKPKIGNALQFSTVAPRPGLARADLPEHGLLGLPQKALYEAESKGLMPETGERQDAFRKRTKAELVAKLDHAQRSAIEGFTNGTYKDIRAREETGTPEVRSTYITQAYDKVKGEQRTVYRGIHLDDAGAAEAVLKMHLTNEVWGLGKNGKLATTSSSWSIDQALSYGNITVNGKGDNTSSYTATHMSVLYKIKNKTGISVETISHYEHEKEILLSRKARYKTTGLSWAKGSSKKVLIVEAEEL